MEIFNTLSKEKEKFKPLSSREVKIYFCGPTVYNYAHIGNLRNYVSTDLTIKTFRYLGYSVKTLMNITDIDDKTIRDSQKSWETLENFTKKYTDIFFQDLSKLSVPEPDTWEPISKTIDTMVEMIQVLINKNYAYLGDDGSIYFSIKRFKNYGKLAHLDMKGMKMWARVDHDEYDKESLADFVLWKAWKSEDGKNKWDEKFIIDSEEKIISGRPGWHLECSALNKKYFGESIDIHMGGCDLIFPHHQNEIAQSEACNKKPFSKYWMHTGHLLVDGEKMSKSKNNFYTLQDLEKKYPGKEEILCRAFRWMNISNHYRSNFNFTFDRVDAAIKTLESFDDFFIRLKNTQAPSGKIRRDFRNKMQEFIWDFIYHLEDDINLIEASQNIFEIMNFTNQLIDSENISQEEKNSIIDLLKNFDSIFTVFDFSKLEQVEIPKEIIELADKRITAKKEKNFQEADALRDEIEKKWYEVLDTKDGYNLEKK